MSDTAETRCSVLIRGAGAMGYHVHHYSLHNAKAAVAERGYREKVKS